MYEPMCVHSNKGSTLYTTTTPHPAVCFFLTLNVLLSAAVWEGKQPSTEGCPTREWLTVIIGDKVTGWVSQCVMKANLCTLGCRRFVSWLPLRWLLWWKRFLAVWQYFLSQRSQAVMLTTCSAQLLYYFDSLLKHLVNEFSIIVQMPSAS